jgi:hypothetical protein
MSFNTIATCASDEALGRRVRSAYAKEGVDNPDPAYYANRWNIAADPSVEQAYAYAIDSGNPNPGGDETAITDAMITAAVQAHPYDPPVFTPPVTG